MIAPARGDRYFIRTARRYRTIEIQAGSHIVIADRPGCRIFDFEHSGWGAVVLDASYLLAPFPIVNTERMTPTAACLIRPAASDESAAVALDGWITGNAGCTAPAGMAHFETARFRSAYSGANSCRFSLHWGVVRCSQFPGAARFPLAGLAFHAGTFLAAAPTEPGRRYPDPLPAPSRFGPPRPVTCGTAAIGG